jgi:hypothetical protein
MLAWHDEPQSVLREAPARKAARGFVSAHNPKVHLAASDEGLARLSASPSDDELDGPWSRFEIYENRWQELRRDRSSARDDDPLLRISDLLSELACGCDEASRTVRESRSHDSRFHLDTATFEQRGTKPLCESLDSAAKDAPVDS